MASIIEVSNNAIKKLSLVYIINSVKTNNDTFDTIFTFNQKYQNIIKKLFEEC